MTRTETIAEALAADGWTMTANLDEPGDRNTESKWSIVLARKGGKVECTYTMGPGHRQWTKVPGVFSGVKGDRLPQFGRLTVREAKDIDKWSEPITPTLDDIVYSLLMDTNSVRHGQTFKDWCDDFGADSDSIKAMSIFNACRDIWAGMVRCGADFDALDLMFQDF